MIFGCRRDVLFLRSFLVPDKKPIISSNLTSS
jgi:hypothetical protein